MHSLTQGQKKTMKECASPGLLILKQSSEAGKGCTLDNNDVRQCALTRNRAVGAALRTMTLQNMTSNQEPTPGAGVGALVTALMGMPAPHQLASGTIM